MRLHLVQLAARAGHRLDPARLQGQAWNEASRESFHTADSQALARVIEHGMELSSALRPEQAAASLSPDGRLFYAALSENIEREMTKLTRAEKEARDGPVVPSAELRHLASAPEPSLGKPGQEPPTQMTPTQGGPAKPDGRRR